MKGIWPSSMVWNQKWTIEAEGCHGVQSTNPNIASSSQLHGSHPKLAHHFDSVKYGIWYPKFSSRKSYTLEHLKLKAWRQA